MRALGWIAGIGLSLGLVFLVLAYHNASDSFSFLNQLMSGRAFRTSPWANQDRLTINLDRLKNLDKLKDKLKSIPGRPPEPPGDDLNYVLQDGRLTFNGTPMRRDLDLDMRNVTVTDVEVNGLGHLNLTHISQDKLSITVSGAGEVSGDGHVGSLDLDISGAGQARLRDVSVDNVKADLDDAGRADLSPKDSADITLNGASQARLATSPKTLTSHVFGFGKIREDHAHEHSDG
jgi:hypothetical protein